MTKSLGAPDWEPKASPHEEWYGADGAMIRCDEKKKDIMVGSESERSIFLILAERKTIL